MRKLGLIGGTGPESTVIYYKKITDGVRRRLGRGRFPHLCIESLDVFEVLDFCKRGDYDGLADYLTRGIADLAAAGAEFAAFTGITPHVVFDEVARRSPIPIVSMLDASCRYAVGRHYGRVALLGTGPTMDGDFFHRPFRAHGIDVVTPDDADKRCIAKAIETELEYGIVRPATQKALEDIAVRLAEQRHADAIVLGCTELPLAFDGVDLPVDVMDVMDIHINALIDRIIGE
ncbi:aspartate/glutamate racemase family protein [Bifidobacterium avesanii]|uniref:Amino acid racemase n=1 Tax=Bifidobacterium avesanii TaxID=1798157 RepID=A0A7K3THM0_9BIFI|nr:amino acid racemase [Bifidobacterium avesanii]KAB8294612.1 aspartate racemase [Bifidobacterium avesanii]NEG78120.1 amino acid racemase [Bifidobacterium avesanii]